MESAPALFHIGNFAVSSYMTTAWAIMLILIVVSTLATKNMQLVPSGIQNFMEMIFETLYNFYNDILGEERGKIFTPMLIVLFLFIVMSNYSGLLPLAGHLPGLSAPTSTISVTAGLALVVFVTTHVSGFKYNGIHYLKHFISPVAFMLPFLIIEEIVKPLSLSLRLYGNIYGEEVVNAQLFNLVPIAVPVIMQLLSVFLGLIQALVFTILTGVYISTSTSKGH